MNKITLSTLLFVLVFCGNIEQVFSQKKDIIYEEKSLGFSVFPSMQGRFLYLPKTEGEDPLARTALMDSFKKADQMRAVINFGVHYRFKTGRSWYVLAGVYYNKMGFTRVRDKVNMLDEIHPRLPERDRIVVNVAQGFPMEVHYHYQYHYIDLPVLFGKEFTPRTWNGTTDTRLFWFTGGSFNTMFNDNMLIQLKGFSGSNDRTRYKVEMDGFKPFPVNISAIIGGRLEVDVYPKTNLFVQPVIQKPLLFATYERERHHLYSLNLEVGLNYSLDKPKK